MDKGIFGNHYFPSGSVGIPHRKCLTLTGNIDQNLDNGSNYSPKTDLKPILGKECIPAGSHEENNTLLEILQPLLERVKNGPKLHG